MPLSLSIKDVRRKVNLGAFKSITDNFFLKMVTNIRGWKITPAVADLKPVPFCSRMFRFISWNWTDGNQLLLIALYLKIRRTTFRTPLIWTLIRKPGSTYSWRAGTDQKTSFLERGEEKNFKIFVSEKKVLRNQIVIFGIVLSGKFLLKCS